MSEPLIYRAAQIRLAEIWDYTLEKWGEEQADLYLRELGSSIRGIASRRQVWRAVNGRRLPGVFFVRSGHHFIFFREVEGRIAVFSILHENMDMLRRLREDDGLPKE